MNVDVEVMVVHVADYQDGLYELRDYLVPRTQEPQSLTYICAVLHTYL